MRRSLLTVLLAVGLAAGSGAPPVQAENYVSWAGGFYITLPDDWTQIDYQTVDAFLLSNQAGRDVLNYDAVFAPKESRPFFVGDYLILTVDTMGELSSRQIDSVLGVMSSTFGQDVKYFPVADFLSDMKSNSPSYDADRKLVTVVSDIVYHDQVTKKLLYMAKFYERGMANFYFYSPDSLFDQSKSLFRGIVETFSTKDIEAAAGKQEVKVADIKPEDVSKEKSDNNKIPAVIYAIPGVLIILIIILAVRKKRRKSA